MFFGLSAKTLQIQINKYNSFIIPAILEDSNYQNRGVGWGVQLISFDKNALQYCVILIIF